MSRADDIVTGVVGLEIHVELDTATKMFCRCRNRFGDPPNSNVCPVCIGMPGVLPVMNRRAVELAMKVGLALDCTVPDFTKWDRKGYYYPDLPKNYQISQYDLPLCVDGRLDVPLSDGSTKRVRILRAHLEEDAGKNIHEYPAHTGVDLNRAGVPLLEIVSQPDMNSVEEVAGYARAMQRLVRWLGASQANMQMGHMRFEPNINLHIRRGEQVFKTPIVEVKNLNSFKALEAAVAYEFDRQYRQWLEDPDFTLQKLGKQNRGFDDQRGITVFQRGKEEAHDYRYFPDPDLVGVVVDAPWRDRLRASIPELPLARRQRYMDQYHLSFKEADALTQDGPTGDLLDEAVRLGGDPKYCANMLLGKVAATANVRGVSMADAGLTADQMAVISNMVENGAISAGASTTIVVQAMESGGDPRALAEQAGLLLIKDESKLEAWVDQVIAANPQAVAEVRSGGKKQKKAFGFLMGEVMKLSGGAAAPAQVQELFARKLGAAGR